MTINNNSPFFRSLSGILGETLMKASQYLSDLSGNTPSAEAENDRTLRISMFVTLSALIALADEKLLPEEENRIIESTVERFSLEKSDIPFIQSFIIQARENKPKMRELCNEYNKHSTYEQRLDLVKDLYEVAWADGNVDPREEKAVRDAAVFMWISLNDLGRIRASFNA